MEILNGDIALPAIRRIVYQGGHSLSLYRVSCICIDHVKYRFQNAMQLVMHTILKPLLVLAWAKLSKLKQSEHQRDVVALHLDSVHVENSVS